MRILKSSILILAFLFVACSEELHKTIYVIGDSTMSDYQENTTMRRGWGEMLPYFTTPGNRIVNCARAGRSSKSFYEEGLWQSVMDSIHAGDYVIIQFAHNDEKEGGRDGADNRGTAPWSTYRTYLRKYVSETRDKGAIPYFATPVVRRYFKNDSLTQKARHNLSKTPGDSAIDYVAAMKSVAYEMAVPVIDMTRHTSDIVEAYGPEASKGLLYIDQDNTHMRPTGAAVFAMVGTYELSKSEVFNGVFYNPHLIANPANYNFGQVFIGDESWARIDIINTTDMSVTGEEPNFYLQPLQVEVTVSDNLRIAKTIDGQRQTRLKLRAPNEHNIYLFYQPNDETALNGIMTIHSGETVKHIKVAGSGTSLKSNSIIEYSLKESKEDTLVTFRIDKERGLKATDKGLIPTSGEWPAEIDEDGRRYVELIVESHNESPISLRKITVTASSNLSYRIAYDFGNDFVARTTIGEAHFEQNDDQMQTSAFDFRQMLSRGQKILIRLYPWSTTESNKKYFNIEDIVIECQQ
ncbi:MAG: rhamnogalacturonan acetylesterase [Marinilabiliaceae bacterium]|nr:rhamnogalacturonan acetylesterase [Marinilabiliaceae bacterium]